MAMTILDILDNIKGSTDDELFTLQLCHNAKKEVSLKKLS